MLALWLASAIAGAAPAVEWTAPPGCPDEAAATGVIASGLASDSTLHVRAIVNKRDDRFEAQVEVTSSAGETRRALESPECATLLDAVALIAQAAEAEADEAAMLESEVEAAGEADVVPEATASESNASTNTTKIVEPAPPVPTSAPKQAPMRVLAVSPYLRATGRIGWGITPVVDAGGGLAIGVQWKRLRVEGYGDVLAPTERAVEGEPNAAVRVFAWSAGLRGCGIAWTDPNERIAIPVCGGAEAGQLIGDGVGEALAAPDRHADVFVAVHAGPALLARLARWASVYAGLDALVLVRRPGFAIAGVDEPVFRPAPAGIRFSLGIEVHFPRRIGTGRGIR